MFETGSWVEEAKKIGDMGLFAQQRRNERGTGNLRSWNFLAYHHSLVVRLATEVNRTVSRTFLDKSNYHCVVDVWLGILNNTPIKPFILTDRASLALKEQVSSGIIAISVLTSFTPPRRWDRT
jgi:hypothetical protein